MTAASAKHSSAQAFEVVHVRTYQHTARGDREFKMCTVGRTLWKDFERDNDIDSLTSERADNAAVRTILVEVQGDQLSALGSAAR